MAYDLRKVPTTEFRGDTMADRKFVDESFTHHRYFSRKISRCEFVRCCFKDLRAWDTHFSDMIFGSCNLRGAALGGVFKGRINRFHRVTFRKTDLRRSAWSAAEFVDCQFIDCRFGPVDFQSCRFTRCTFVGEVREALFYDRGFSAPDQPPNEMFQCDFSKARVPWSDFRRLDLTTLIGPTGESTFILHNYRNFLEAAVRESKEDEKVFKAMMQHKLKWAGPNQQTGYFDQEELEDYLGSDWRRRVEEIQKNI